MRIIAGERKGFPLAAPPGKATRPTLGRVRESLFSILSGRVIDAHIVDLFAGAGGLGLEALSRGAADCVFVEKSRGAVTALSKNIEKLRYTQQARIAPEDVYVWIRKQRQPFADVVFLDPPYAEGAAQKSMEALQSSQLLLPDALIIVQCGINDPIADQYEMLTRTRTEKYGATIVHFFLSIAP